MPVVAWHKPGGHLPHTAASNSAHSEAVDLLDREAVRAAFERARPVSVYHCAGAAHVGRSWDNAESTFAVPMRSVRRITVLS